MNKAQTTIEFIFTAGMVMFILIVISVMVMQKSIELGKLNNDLKQRDDCFKIANLITYSFLTGADVNTKLKYPVDIYPDERRILVNKLSSCSMPIAAVIQTQTYTNDIEISKEGDYIYAN